MKTNSKWVLWVIMALLVGMFLVCPVGAQETTGQAGTTVGAGQQAAQSPDIFSLTIGELIGIVLGLGALGVGIGKILWDGSAWTAYD